MSEDQHGLYQNAIWEGVVAHKMVLNSFLVNIFLQDIMVLPAHCKNDIGPEAGTKDVFKQLDHAFQAMCEPRTLSKIK